MIDFFHMLSNFYFDIVRLLNGAIITGGKGNNMVTSLGGLIFVCLVLGFAVNVFWKGARA